MPTGPAERRVPAPRRGQRRAGLARDGGLRPRTHRGALGQDPGRMHRRGEGSDVDRHRAGRTRGRPRGPTNGAAGKRHVRRLRLDDDRGVREDAEGGRPGRSARNARGVGGVRVMREVAWRLFASEYNDTTLEMDGGGERAPSYVVTPLGAKVNRVFVVGVITDVENVGTDIQPMWRARVSDPT